MSNKPNTSNVVIRPVSEITPSFNLLLHGDAGSGKTTFASTLAEHDSIRKMLLINIEGGMLSVKNAGDKVEATDKIKTMQEFEDLYWFIASGNHEYDAICVDSGTELQTLCLENLVAQAIIKNGQSDRSVDDVHLQDYGRCTKMLQRLFRGLRDLPQHTIITALTKRIVPDPTSGTAQTQSAQYVIEAYPSFTEKLARSVMGYMDFVWYMYEDSDNNRHACTKTVNNYRAKSRGSKDAPLFEPRISGEDLNLSRCYDMLLKNS